MEINHGVTFSAINMDVCKVGSKGYADVVPGKEWLYEGFGDSREEDE